MNFISFEELNNCIYKNLHKLPRDIDLIVGIPRSGTLVANILALYLNLPFTDIDNFLNQGTLRTGSTRKCSNWVKHVTDAKKVLIVDDSISSGKALLNVKKEIKDAGIEVSILYLAVYAMHVNRTIPDIYFDTVEQPRIFEWNYMHHWLLEYTCMDIDGVMCVDPTFLQNRDEKKYEDFLENATPLMIPTQKVGAVVSCRLEKHRELTENWLKKHGVLYDKLILCNCKDTKERMLNFNHAKYKADVYKNAPQTILFIESEYTQAIDICKYSGKPVFCVASRTLITPDNVIDHAKVMSKEWKITLKRVVKKILGKINYVE